MLHLIEYINNLWSSFKERVDNPFQARTTTPFGSAFLVYLVLYNWVLIYSVFTFDNTTSLNQRILFIQDYIQRLEIIRMLFKVIGYSYISIVLFYLTTNLSLIITLVFKKIRIWILSNLERNKLVTIEELNRVQQSTTYLRDEIIDIRKQLEESEVAKKSIESENISLKSDLKTNELDVKNLKKTNEDLIRENERLKLTYAGLVAQRAEFKLISAYYGVEGFFANVKDKLEQKLAQQARAEIMNHTFHVDPIRGRVKQLEITFELQGEIQSAVFQEYDTIALNEAGLIVESRLITDKEKGEISTNANSLFELMQENWQLEYSKDSNLQNEDVVINPDNIYFRNGVEAFFIKNFRNNGPTISFDKYNIDGSLHANEDLIKLSKSEFIGVDSLGYRLVYRKK